MELVHEREISLVDEAGVSYDRARVYAERLDTGRWAGFIEFVAADGMSTCRTARETTQRDLGDLAQWATGLGSVYFEGALERALRDPAFHDLPEPVPTGPPSTSAMRTARLEIDGLNPSLPLELMGTSTLVPGQSRRIQDTAVLVYEGTVRSATTTDPGRYAFLVHFVTDNSAALVANFLWSELHDKASMVSVEGWPVDVTNSALKETLIARAA